jgi:hypothetical protein
MPKRRNVMKVNILGTEYEIIKGSVLNCPSLKELDGFTDYTVKQIVVLDFGAVEKDDRSVKDFEFLQKQVLRHEIIHAFLLESGLNVNSNDVKQWATNEEMVDWFAIQLPKLSKAFKEAGCE